MQSKNNREDLSSARHKFRKRGYCVLENYLEKSECDEVLRKIEEFRSGHKLQRIHRRVSERSLDYFVIDGYQIEKQLPEFLEIFRASNELVNDLDHMKLVPLRDARAALNVNITPPGGEYRWHYDRNRVTALLYLNEVQGGEIEFCPRYRWKISNRWLQSLQDPMDSLLRLKTIRSLFAETITVTPAPGRLVVMRGDISLHSVRAVTGDQWRFNLVMSYDSPENVYRKSAQLDRYLYDAN